MTAEQHFGLGTCGCKECDYYRKHPQLRPRELGGLSPTPLASKQDMHEGTMQADGAHCDNGECWCWKQRTVQTEVCPVCQTVHDKPLCPAPTLQAPIAKVIVREDGPADVMLYAPGLPPGEHDLYCETPAPGGQKVPHPCFEREPYGWTFEIDGVSIDNLYSYEHDAEILAAEHRAAGRRAEVVALYDHPAPETPDDLIRIAMEIRDTAAAHLGEFSLGNYVAVHRELMGRLCNALNGTLPVKTSDVPCGSDSRPVVAHTAATVRAAVGAADLEAGTSHRPRKLDIKQLLADARASVAKAADADCVCVGPPRCKYCAPHRALLERIDAALSSPVDVSGKHD